MRDDGRSVGLDYSLKTVEERRARIDEILAKDPHPSPRYLTYMADYLLFTADAGQTAKERESEHPIVTKNREVTHEKRQVSLDSMTSSMRNGEDGLYSRISDNPKNSILNFKDPVTEDDEREIPGVSELMRLVRSLESKLEEGKVEKGKSRYAVKSQIIEAWRQMHLLKSSFRTSPVHSSPQTTGYVKMVAHMDLPEDVWVGDGGMPRSDSPLTLLNPDHVSFLLQNYPLLKEESQDDLNCDMHFLLMDLEDLVDRTVGDDEMLMDLVIWKIDGKTNEKIADLMEEKYGVRHNEQYFSTLWRNKIPKMVSRQYAAEWLVWHYTEEERGNWKTCGRCGQVKLAHPVFFSKNSTSDGFYSICKVCRADSASVASKRCRAEGVASSASEASKACRAEGNSSAATSDGGDRDAS